MKTYLRVINPTGTLVVLFPCRWAALFDEGHFKRGAVLGDGIGDPTSWLRVCSAVLLCFWRAQLSALQGEEAK